MVWITVEKLMHDSMLGHGYSEVSRLPNHIGKLWQGSRWRWLRLDCRQKDIFCRILSRENIIFLTYLTRAISALSVSLRCPRSFPDAPVFLELLATSSKLGSVS